MPPRDAYPDMLPRARPAWPLERLAAFLKKTELLGGAPDSARALARAATVQRLRRGGVLCEAGEPALDVWILLEGRVAVRRPLADGRTHSLELMLPGEAFGLPALACWRYPSSIEAERDSVVAAFRRDRVLAEAERSPALARATLRILGQRLAFLESQVSWARAPVPERLAAALVYLEHKFGRRAPLTRAEIAALAGTATETAMRALTGFARKGLVRLGRGGVEFLDLEGLRRLAAYSADASARPGRT